MEYPDIYKRGPGGTYPPRPEKMPTEVIFEVTVRHFVTESDPNPSEEDIRVAVERHLDKAFDVEQVRAERI